MSGYGDGSCSDSFLGRQSGRPNNQHSKRFWRGNYFGKRSFNPRGPTNYTSRGRFNVPSFRSDPSQSNFVVAPVNRLPRVIVLDRDVKQSADNVQFESLLEKLQYQLSNEIYECSICVLSIRRSASIWSCGECFAVYHVGCIVKWSKQATEGSDWRCPACQFTYSKNLRIGYICFCGKLSNPPTQTATCVPHSCGIVCGKKRKSAFTHNRECVHECVVPCHPGPCPKCEATVLLSCHCELTTLSVKCKVASQGDLDTFSALLSCGKVCGKNLSCNKHCCNKVCHHGDCDRCDVESEQICYCGKSKRIVNCEDSNSAKSFYSCETTCGKQLRCENHNCQKLCHAGDCADCCLSPLLQLTCGCKKFTLLELTGFADGNRKKCTDKVPSCNRICNNTFSYCEHSCQKMCHVGDCEECPLSSVVSCLCGRARKMENCADIAKLYLNGGKDFKCSRRCNKNMSCGRHQCDQICCDKAVHQCNFLCGRRLGCKRHTCEELCGHTGACPKCYNVSFDELPCECGASVRLPPIECGEKPPPCASLCTREHACDHPVRHNCHSEEACPPCVELLSKWCPKKHIQLNNIPCCQDVATCGYVCSEPLPKCSHKCDRLCHEGPCLSTNADGVAAVCRQPCQKLRSACSHFCGLPCHEGTTCVDVPNNLCKSDVLLTCSCGRLSIRMWCSQLAQNKRMERTSSMLMAAAGEASVKIVNGDGLQCDDVCKQMKRNRKMAEALSLSADLHTSESFPTYSQTLIAYARKDMPFILMVEEQLEKLMNAITKTEGQTYARHMFDVMNKQRRTIVHELTDYYDIVSETLDKPPIKSVMVAAEFNKSKFPTEKLSDFVTRKFPFEAARLSDKPKTSNQAAQVPQSTSAWTPEGNLKALSLLMTLSDTDRTQSDETPTST